MYVHMFISITLTVIIVGALRCAGTRYVSCGLLIARGVSATGSAAGAATATTAAAAGHAGGRIVAMASSTAASAACMCIGAGST